MIRRASIILLVSLLLVSVLALSASAAVNKQNSNSRVKHGYIGNRIIDKSLRYSFGDEDIRVSNGGTRSIAPSSVAIGERVLVGGEESPGVIIGNTWYDYQHNCSMGRMIDCGPHTDEVGYTIVHMGWMYLPSKKINDDPRSYAYNCYFSTDHSTVGQTILMTEDEYAGYVQVDVTPDNRAIVGGHNNPPDSSLITKYSSEFRFDGGPGYATFPNILRVPDSTQTYAQNNDLEYTIWPKFFFQFGTDTVIHVAAKVKDLDSQYAPGAVVYFRKAGFEGSTDTEWDYPPYVVDTVEDIAQDIIGQRTGDRVCMVWFASLCYDDPLCDTCSSISTYTDGKSQRDNDIYYQESLDQGLTWEPRVNLTKVQPGAPAYKAYCDASVLYDSEENLHIIWHACPWAADPCWETGESCFSDLFWGDNARLFHWSENVPYIRPIADQVYEWSPLGLDSCWAGAWMLRISKMTISECDGKLYAMWTQFLNPKEGDVDDCALWAEDGDPTGAANGELWVSVSEDWGMTWDYQRNLTNSKSPDCDFSEGEDCESDCWASMSRIGRKVQYVGDPGIGDHDEDWSEAVVVDPSGGTYTGDYYLDIQYINDRDAGGIVVPEGSWTDNPVKWFRLACVDPVPSPIFTADWQYLGDPSYVKPGEYLDTLLLLENIGNVGLSYQVDIVYDDESDGWLGYADFSGYIPSGLEGQERTMVTVDATSLSYGNYYGHLAFTGSASGLPLDVTIELIVADTIIPPYEDSVLTSCLGLILTSIGNMGSFGEGELNMDYVRYGEDCDTNLADVYMFDGSPFVGWIDGTDTVITSSMWGASYILPTAFRPQGGEVATENCLTIDANVFHTGVMTTQDSTIGVSRVVVAPASGDCNFIITYTKVWSYDGQAHDGLVIGEGYDWDVPSDCQPEDVQLQNTADNYGFIDATRNLVYMQGYDAYGEGSDTLFGPPFTGSECENEDLFNDERFAGNAFIESYLNGSPHKTVPDRGFVGRNDSLSGNANWVENRFYEELVYTTGFTASDTLTDLNTAIAFETDFDLGASDVLEAVCVLATVHQGDADDLKAAIDAGKAWYQARGGMAMFEDTDAFPGRIDACNYCCLNMGKFYNDGEPFSILDIDAFLGYLFRSGVIYDCFDQVDVGGPDSQPGTPEAWGTLVPDGIISILDVNDMCGYQYRAEYEDLGSCP